MVIIAQHCGYADCHGDVLANMAWCLVHACNHSTQEMEAGGNIRYCLKKQNGARRWLSEEPEDLGLEPWDCKIRALILQDLLQVADP